MFKKISTILILVFSVSAFSAANLDGYKKRFKLIKNDQGELTYVQMNFLTKKLSIVPYLKQIKDDIKAEIARMNSKSYENDIQEFYNFLDAHAVKSAEHQESVLAVKDSLNNLKNVEVDKFFANVKTKNVLERFRKKLQEALRKYSLANIASVEDPKYFYKRNVTYLVVKEALEFAQKKFGNIPLLNLASFVIVKVHDMVLEQRLFHQNMLLHYLQNFSEAELGMTFDEANKVFSSIYESRISPINYRESQAAAADWAKYGLNKFYAMVRSGNNRLRRATITFDEVGSRLNFAFFIAKENGERVIKNLVHNKHSFSGKMATAYYLDKPDKVRRFRSLLNLGQVGLGFLPLPGWLKKQADSFIESFYVEQKILEGALIAYFESNQDSSMASAIKKQNINPYILFH